MLLHSYINDSRRRLPTLLVLLASCVLIWGGLDRALLRASDDWGTIEWVEKCEVWKQASKTDVGSNLYVGDSLVSTGIRPRYTRNGGFNLGRGGLVPADLESLTRQLLAMDARPKRLYLCITIESFFHSSSAAFDSSLDQGVLLLRNFYKAPNLAGTLWLPGRLSTRRSIVQRLLALHGGPRTFAVDTDGFRITLEPIVPSALPPFIPDPGCEDPIFLAEIEKNLQSFRDEWERRGTKVFWVALPVSGRRTRDFEQNFPSLFHGATSMINSTFQGRILRSTFCPSEDDFVDGLHLKPEAALRFTLALEESQATRPFDLKSHPLVLQPGQHLY